VRYERAGAMTSDPVTASDASASSNPESRESVMEPLRAAIHGKRASGVEVLRAEAPPLLDGAAMRAMMSLLMAGFIVGAALLRTRMTSDTPFDLMALLLRTAALAFVVRAVLALFVALRAFADKARARNNVLAWSEAGMLEQTPEGERFLLRKDVLGILLEERPERSLVAQSKAVWVAALPRNRKVQFWQLTAHYAGKPEILCARLAPWLQPRLEPTERREREPSSLEERYARAARGKPGEGEVAVPEGFGYRRRAPYAALLGIVFALDALWSAGALRARILSPALLSCVLALVLFVGWFVWMGKRRASRLGIAMLITPEELLVRGPGGVMGVPWSQLASAQVHARMAWSPFWGSFAVRTLVVGTTHGETLSFDAGFLGVPPEVLAAVLESYRPPL
jgi:hypothetical protein